ncbi:hypothetical protein [Ancylobacter defluvii]|uniref:hypothetical protein n=1 Tax=Ancylobacter defluvii TaxID=1282440 RepID=UPI001BCE4369|nr:hypothetical protein [Ancylobacter defluvii]MBS7588502.1 hypothetical protein [Ancylobacter defluvii]
MIRRIETTAASPRAWHRFGQRQPWLSKLLDYRPLQILLAVIGLGLVGDFGIGWYQRQQTTARQ